MKSLIALTAALAALVLAAPAGAQVWPGVEQPQLEQRLPTHVRVYCATVDYPGAAGWTWLEAPEIFLSAETCAELQNGNFAYAYLVLFHEWWHQAFHERNESATNTGAVAVYRWWLRHYWHFDPLKAQAFYDALWILGFAPGYQVTIGQNAVDPLIALDSP